MFKKKSVAQSWSLDIFLAFIVFILVIGIFYTLVNSSKSPKTEQLQLQANTIANNLDISTGLKSNFAVMEKGNIDKQKLTELYASNYGSLKSQFGIKGDFCIYIVDQYNNLITVTTAYGEMNGFGNGNVTINGKPCGSQVS